MPFPEWLRSTSDEARFLRTVLDHVSDCLVAVDTAGRIVLINRPYCKLLGGEEDDFIGRHITDVVSPQTRLHLVARGENAVVGYPLDVRGQRLITKQVPVVQDGEIIGALGLALFSDFEALRQTYSRLSQDGLAIINARTPWRPRYSIDDIIGRGTIMDRVRERIRQAAAHTLPVLVEGETGTGKELAAHAIHRLSDCSDGPFVWMNCASIPAELIDAELFGYEGGAFTGARARGKPGKFELAKGGTLFLDEIGDMPLHLQSSLLRAVQSGEIVRVGGTSPIQIETRIICATNRPLSDLVDKGTFRPDLFYRLDVFQIAMPSLRDRSDKEEFIDVLLSRISHRQGIAPPPLTASAKAQLIQHDWPGNVRELESVLMRFVITGKIKVSQLKETMHLPSYSETAKAESLPHNSLGLKSRLLQEKNRAIEEALRKTGDDKNRAAALLGISRAQLYREIGRIHDDSDAP